MKILGQETPLSFIDNFDLIDIPITYFASLQDNLCRPDDIAIQYLTLQRANPSLAHIKVFNGYNHVDFTYMINHTMINAIMKTLKGEDDHQMPKEWINNEENADCDLS